MREEKTAMTGLGLSLGLGWVRVRVRVRFWNANLPWFTGGDLRSINLSRIVRANFRAITTALVAFGTPKPKSCETHVPAPFLNHEFDGPFGSEIKQWVRGTGKGADSEQR